MRILAVDGGGVRGVVPSATLAYWENELKFDAPECFDVYAGTSTGAIVAAALALGLSARKVVILFQDRAEEIFSREGLKFAERALSFKGWAVPAYTNGALRESLEGAFGQVTLGDCPKPLSIPCLDVVTGETHIFRSGHHRGPDRDMKVRVVDAVLASAAAPTFFPSAQVAGSSYIDGGMWANNPSMIAILDTLDLAGNRSLDNIQLVSLGCGKLSWGKPVGFGERRGLVGWGAPLMSLMLSAQADGVHGYVRRLLSEKNYLRVDPRLPRELSILDNVENIPSLMVHAAGAARSSLGAFRDLMAAPTTGS